MNLYEILQNPDRVGEGMTHFERLFAQKIGGGKINEISGVPPLRYIGNGRPLTDYLISGNAVQDGTPTPESPVPVVGCGTDTAGGYKLPLTVNGVEYPIYLGQVETTRRIKKLVLTGEERITRSGEDANRVIGYISFPGTGMITSVTGYCNILQWKSSYSQSEYNRIVAGGRTGFYMSIVKSALPEPTFEGFIAYLAQQYTNGTPVTVWYVLAEPETAVVNEPLMKIGDYADTVSFAQSQVAIPTVNGANVLDVPTEVKPSDVWIRGRIKEV